MKIRVSLLILLLGIVTSLGTYPSSAAVTWSIESKKDTVFDGSDYNAQYDVEYVSAQIFDNHPDEIYFYMEFFQVPRLDMFNDGLGSFGFIGLDYDLDGKRDIRLETPFDDLTGDSSWVKGDVYDPINKKTLNCELRVFTSIDKGAKWIGFKVSRKCIALPLTFDMYAYAQYNTKDNSGSFDVAPFPYLRTNLPGSTISTPSNSSGVSASGATFSFPLSIANSSKDSSNFTVAPSNLSNLSDVLLPSVATIKCGSGSGTGWSADLQLSKELKDSGFQNVLVTNHHVIEDCLGSKAVTVVTSTGSSLSGQIISWNEGSDVAGVAVKSAFPTLQWIGSAPKQGWWVGVLGSPLGKTNVLTTGIISSVNTSTKKFTLTAAINPGNSGGPVFDNTGRVLGLATSKAVLSDGQLAEGFGNAHGVPLLCGTVVSCQIEPDPWNSKALFPAGPTPEELAAQAAVKAASEAKQRDEFKNQCIRFNGDLDVAVFNTKNALSTYPNSASIFNGLVKNAPARINCDSIQPATFEAELQSKRNLLNSFEAATSSAIATAKKQAAKKTTITCVNGKLTKKVTAINPKCPRGYKKK